MGHQKERHDAVMSLFLGFGSEAACTPLNFTCSAEVNSACAKVLLRKTLATRHWAQPPEGGFLLICRFAKELRTQCHPRPVAALAAREWGHNCHGYLLF